MTRLALPLLMAMAALLPVGCAIGPQPCSCQGHGGSVSGDVADYLQREWMLGAPNGAYADDCGDMVPYEAACQEPCFQGCGPPGPLAGWIARRAAKPKPLPAVPNEPGPPGRFFPVPVRPVFEPQHEPVAAFDHPGA